VRGRAQQEVARAAQPLDQRARTAALAPIPFDPGRARARPGSKGIGARAAVAMPRCAGLTIVVDGTASPRKTSRTSAARSTARFAASLASGAAKAPAPQFR